VDFLLGQQKDGVFLQKGEPHVGVTALALGAVLTKPTAQRNDREQRFVQQATEFLLAQQNEDGSFAKQLSTYQTSAAVMALAKLDGEKVKQALAKARDFLVFAQNVEHAAVNADEANYGSYGYGPKNRGDLSNTQFAIEALHASGLPANHEAFAKAIAFLQRTQNLRSVNDYRTEVAEKDSTEKFPVAPGDDGGAAYYPGNSKLGYDLIADGVRVPRSYGSMTYALLKTYALCGVKADDPRMKAAADWIRRNWTVATNPGAHAGMGDDAPYQGLFYYYETMARALTVCGVDVVETLGGTSEKVDWRAALSKHLAEIQREDGSWLNEKNGRWWEDQPVMCTIYALLALGDCRSASAEK
jgi:squalene-hopene/tetraprenyl-beta-curcumene cyclase